MASFQTATQFLQLTEVKDLIEEQKLLSVSSSQPLSEAMKLLLEQRISSLPVFDDHMNRFSTFIDTIDITTHALNVLNKYEEDGQLSDEGLTKAKVAFSTALCGSVANMSRSNPYFQVQAKDSLKVCLARMVSLSNLHRLPVLTSSGGLLGVLTQSQIVAALAKNIHLFSFSSKTVEELQLGYRDVVSVHYKKAMKDAFVLIAEHKTSGLAVVQNGEEIYGNVSASDIKLIGTHGENFRRVYEPIVTAIESTQARSRPVSVTPDTTFAQVCQKIQAERLHRLFVVNKADQLVGVIRLITILNLVQDYA